ncbi:MAG: hypothetical protein MK066_12375 [Crocinitomicaceae bacterium]|nr:hypothetical protein [Crocinitomicaceae bacterium]
MKWIGERISFVDDKQKTTIVIHPENVGWVRGAMGAWVAMWTTIGAIVIWSSFTFKFSEQENIALYVFLAFWLYFMVKISRSFFWLLWGKELIKIDEASFTYKRSVKSYGKAKSYLLGNISKVRVFTPKERSIQSTWEKSPWVRGGERLEFDYLGKVARFGRKLNSKDAELLFRFITKKIDRQIRKSN